MNTYNDYIKRSKKEKVKGLHPKPIDGAELLSELFRKLKIQITSTEQILYISLFTMFYLVQLVLLVLKLHF